MKHVRLFKTLLICFSVLFLLIYGGRIIYELNTPARGPGYGASPNATIDYAGSALSPSSLNVNYASERVYFTADTGAEQFIEQKYEKTADISTLSTDFDADSTKVYKIIDDNGALIQQENKSGLEGKRSMNLIIGVKPDNFEKVADQISKIGEIQSTNTTKTDRTAQYRQMIADRGKLEATKESYIALRSKGGSIYEMLQLEQSIIEIEGQILNQNVSLGDFSDENSLCTVNFSIAEKAAPKNNGRSFSAVLWSALMWSCLCYLAVMLFIALVFLSAMAVLFMTSFGKKWVKKLFSE